jgi:hypothetical protein
MSLSALVTALRSVSPYQNCFELAAQKRDVEALELVARTRSAIRNNRFVRWDVELQLLEAYLLLEQGSFRSAQLSLRGIFNRIKSLTDYNPDEQAVLIRYGISVLWLARGRIEPSCLLDMRNLRTFDTTKVRASMLRHFPNPDEAA